MHDKNKDSIMNGNVFLSNKKQSDLSQQNPAKKSMSGCWVTY